MDSNIQRILGIGMTVIIFIVIAMVALGFVDFGQGMASDANDELVRFNDQLNRGKFAAYDLTEISGTDVVSAIRNYNDRGGDFLIQVTTGLGTNQYISTGTLDASGNLPAANTLTATGDPEGDLADAKDNSHGNYINPSGRFDSRLGTDANGVIRIIVFVQK